MIFAHTISEKKAEGTPAPSALLRAFASTSDTNEWTEVNDIIVARSFTSCAEEYAALTERAGLVDLGCFARYTIRGDRACDFLARLTSAPVSDLEMGESGRGLVLDAAGYVVDHADVTRLAEDVYLLVLSSPADRRMITAARGMDVEVERLQAHVAALGVIGPEAATVAEAAGFVLNEGARASPARVRGVEAIVRSVTIGGIGGLEIVFPADEAITIFERIKRSSDIASIGLDACEVLRLEGGGPRKGLDYAYDGHAETSPHTGLHTSRHPGELGLPHLAPLDRGWFNGRRALDDAPRRRRLVTLALDADTVDVGAGVYPPSAGRRAADAIGVITSAAYSPKLRAAVAMADIDAATKIGSALRVGAQAIAGVMINTHESRLADAFLERQKPPTESRRFFV